jgi:hypothetical protein
MFRPPGAGRAVPDARERERWRLVLTELSLVFICGATAVVGLLETLNCLNEGQLTEPAVCKSSSVESWYPVGLAAGAAIAVVGIAAGHFRHRLAIVITTTGLSLAVLIATMLWGLRSVPVPQYG